MDEELYKIETFFKIDTLIKEIIADSFIKPEDCYDIASLDKYTSSLKDKLIKIEILFTKIAKILYLEETYKQYSNILFSYYMKRIEEVPLNYQSLVILQNEIFAQMNPKVINMVNSNLIGYIMFHNLREIIASATSINELLHIFHSYIINNEEILQRCNKIDTKYSITLYGKNTNISQSIFDSLDDDMPNSEKTILSINESHIIIMLRDYGHATTLDININGDLSTIDYFIPKVCNYIMVNNLPGVTKVNSDSRWAKGKLEVRTDDLGTFINTFIKLIPNDDHMFIEGGLAYLDKNRPKL